MARRCILRRWSIPSVAAVQAYLALSALASEKHGQHLKYKLVKNGDVIRWGIRSAKVDGACRRERRRTSEAVDGVGIANRLTVL